MKLLILTQYFPPEVGAPQNRLYELAIRLKQKGVDVTVLTAMPNYPQMKIYAGYEGKENCEEEMNGLKIFRTSIYIPKSKSITERLKNYFSFTYSSWKFGRKLKTEFDFLLVESPPLFLGISAYLLSKKLKAKMIFNVSDLWPESAEKLGLVTNKFFLRMATWLEEWLYRKSFLITGQTQGIVKNIQSRFPNKKVYWLPNGVDIKLFDSSTSRNKSWRIENGFSENDKLFIYAGIIGHAQGLEIILKAAEKCKDRTEIKFLLVGSGPEKEKLQKMKSELKLENVFFFDVQSKENMPSIIDSMDATIIPLKKLDLFLGAIPSKVFENLAMKKPILLGVDGEARELFIEHAQAGIFFEPENENQLANAVLKISADEKLKLQLGENGFNYVKQKFNRDIIAEDFFKQFI